LKAKLVADTGRKTACACCQIRGLGFFKVSHSVGVKIAYRDSVQATAISIEEVA
jgi:hypothetical protein